jgi:2'-5' RNA ligase
LAGLEWKPFQAAVCGVGFFPPSASARVLWAGLEAPTIKGLAEQIDSRLQQIGIEKEKRAFRAHITLARARHSRLDRVLLGAAGDFKNQDFGNFIVDRCFLYQSTPSVSKTVYKKLREYPLTADEKSA